MDLGLTDRVALITGGSTGLGRATAEVLAAEGAKVVIVARDAGRLADAAHAINAFTPGAATAIAGDVMDPSVLAQIVGDVLDTHGRIDILVNNAGVSRAMPFLTADDAAWQEDLDLKVMAAVRLARLVIPGMQRQGGGRIVNVLNTAAKAPGGASAPTSVSRAAGLAMTKVLSKEFAADGILVNAVLIGLVRSDQWDRQWKAAGSPGTLDEWYARFASGVPVGRVAEAREFGELVAFLVSERARYITGTAVNFDGGASAVI